MINDGRIQLLTVFLNNFHHVVRNKGGRFPGVGIDVLMQVAHGFGERLFCFLVEVGNSNPRSEHRIIGVLGG